MSNLSLDNKLDHNLKPIKVGEDSIPLEVSNDKLWYQKTPTDQYEVVNKKYVDDNAGGGTTDTNHHTIIHNVRYSIGTTATNVFYSGYPSYYSHSTNVDASITNRSDTTVYSYIAQYAYLIPFVGTLVDFRADLRVATSSSGEFLLDAWKIDTMAATGTISSSVPIAHIGTITFEDPSDTSYIHAHEACASLDGTAAAFTAGEHLMITGSKSSGTDGTYWYINSAATFSVTSIG